MIRKEREDILLTDFSFRLLNSEIGNDQKGKGAKEAQTLIEFSSP